MGMSNEVKLQNDQAYLDDNCPYQSDFITRCRNVSIRVIWIEVRRRAVNRNKFLCRQVYDMSKAAAVNK